MRPWLPPVLRGKIPTTPGRLLAAAAAMLVVDLCLFWEQGVDIIVTNFYQVVGLIIVLLLSPRRWVALLLMLPLWYIFTPGILAIDEWVRRGHLLLNLVPLIVGVLTAWPRPRKRWVYVEEDDEDADSPAH